MSYIPSPQPLPPPFYATNSRPTPFFIGDASRSPEPAKWIGDFVLLSIAFFWVIASILWAIH